MTDEHLPAAESTNELPITPERLEALKEEHPADVAEVIETLPTVEGAKLIAALPPATAADALAQMQARDAGILVEDMAPRVAASTVEHMPMDAAADLLAELPEEHREQILAVLAAEDRAQLETLMAYAPDTAGGMMSPEVAALPEDLTIPEAVVRLREFADQSETVYYTYVVDGQNRLIGVLSLRDLILAPAQQTLREIMRENVLAVPPEMDRNEVAELLQKYGYYALPVVDAENHLLGIVTIDDVVDVIQAEATEDMHRMVGAGADEHIDSPVPFVWRRRIPWLLLNLGTAFLASFVVGAFEHTLRQLTVLAVLLPIVAGQAGNTGLQSLAVMIRSIAMGETRGLRLAWIVTREVWIGVGAGSVIALTCGCIAYAWRRDLALALVLGAAMVLCMLVATVSGALVPWLMKRLGFDPAQSASIILTTITDVAGFGVFLGLGTLLLARSG
jgi:magnesium transporter